MDVGQNQAPNADQLKYWGSDPGRKWVDWQEPLDTAFAGVNAVLLERASPALGERVLEIGCGAGATTFALAERVRPGGHVLAADISSPLLAKARERTPPHLADSVEFIEADAQTFGFQPFSTDLLASRFGVMFFEDPVAAFSNMRRALRQGARMCVAAWAPVELNPWFSIPRDCAIAQLGQAPAASPTAPGPMAFSNEGYVMGILREAGFEKASCDATPVMLQPPGGPEDVARLLCNIGPASRLMLALNGSPEDGEAIGRALQKQMTAFRTGSGGMEIPAVLNIFTARAP